MAGLLSAVTTLTEIFNKVDKENITGKELLKAVNSKNLRLMNADGSMLSLINNYIVEPVIVVSNDLKNEDIMDGLLNLHTDIFSAFYMQTFDILRAHFGITDNVAIDSLGTDNGGLKRLILKGAQYAVEDYDYLGDVYRGTISFNDTTDLSTENENLNKAYAEAMIRNKAKADLDYQRRPKDLKATTLHQGQKDLLIPGAIMRTLEITITRPMMDPADPSRPSGRDLTVVIPINIKAHILFTDIENIMNATDPRSDDKGFFNRLDEYRSGAISLMDLVFASDIIKKYKNNKLKDKDDLMKLLASRELSANSKIATQGFPGFEKYYNMYIISADNAIRLDNRIRGKVTKERDKEKFLTQAYGLSITIVDQDYERVKIMMKDLKGSSDLTFKGVVKNDKKGGADMSELVKALVASRPPVF